MAMYRSTVIAHKFQIEVKMASIATRWGISVLQSAIFLQKKSVGKKSSPTEKSDTARDKTNMFGKLCSRRFVAIRKITKAFPKTAKVLGSQPIM